MKGDIGAMKNIRYDDTAGLDLPKEVQLRRMQRVMEAELTPPQKEVLMLYYFEDLRPAEIARIRGVNRSAVLRMLRRAEGRLQKFLKY